MSNRLGFHYFLFSNDLIRDLPIQSLSSRISARTAPSATPSSDWSSSLLNQRLVNWVTHNRRRDQCACTRGYRRWPLWSGVWPSWVVVTSFSWCHEHLVDIEKEARIYTSGRTVSCLEHWREVWGSPTSFREKCWVQVNLSSFFVDDVNGLMSK